MENFLREYYYKELEEAVQGDGVLVIDFEFLDRYNHKLADKLLTYPEETLQKFNEAVKEMELSSEGDIIVRVHNIPESRNIRIRELRAEHLDKLWCIDAIVKSASEVKPQIYEAVFECPECGAHITVEQTGRTLQKASVCDCGRRGDFELVEQKMHDVRMIQGVEPFEITTGEQPGEIVIMMKKDLTVPKLQKKSDPGKRLKITGVLKTLPKWIAGKLSLKMDTYMETIYFENAEIDYDEIEIEPEDENAIKELSKDEKIYDKLIDSIAPGIYGHREIKESIVLQMFGGLPHTLPDGSKLRENIHILITGDPSVGKSRILNLASEILPRAKYASGKGVTGAGLTASVVRNEILGGWILEAGAIVLANKSLMAIDEFDKMNHDDQVAMHECMSLGTVSIAKASISATLPANTAILAGANPKLGRFDMYKSIAEQIDIPETLLSRFDLKFALKDQPDKARDRELADHMLKARSESDDIKPVIEPLLLRKYLAYAKRILKIKMAPEAAKKMRDFYVDMRNRYVSDETPTISITLRQYEALIRLSEASAKIRLAKEINSSDSERAIRLMKFSLRQLGTDFETGRIDVDRMESGITSSKRNKIRQVMDIIEKLEKELGKEVPMEDVLASTEEQGINNAEEIINKLKDEGMIFQPKSGFVRKV